jgi:hypothetical protein
MVALLVAGSSGLARLSGLAMRDQTSVTAARPGHTAGSRSKGCGVVASGSEARGYADAIGGGSPGLTERPGKFGSIRARAGPAPSVIAKAVASVAKPMNMVHPMISAHGISVPLQGCDPSELGNAFCAPSRTIKQHSPVAQETPSATHPPTRASARNNATKQSGRRARIISI